MTMIERIIKNFRCAHCGKVCLRGSRVPGLQGTVCTKCAEGVFTCGKCREIAPYLLDTPEDERLCPSCFDKLFVVCEHCDEICPVADTVEHDGVNYCWDCFDRLFGVCEQCDEIHPIADILEQDGGNYCRDCFDRLFGICEHCEETRPFADLLEENGSHYCPDCFDRLFDRCEYCDEICYSGDICEQDGTNYCGNCFSTLFATCDSCGETLLMGETVVQGWDRYCTYCCPTLLREYSYSPAPIFNGLSPNMHKHDIAYGLELETDGYSNSENISNLLEDLDSDSYYCKRDESLRNGVEIVFHPRTTESWRSYANTLEEIVATVKENGGLSYDKPTCGIHVHRGHSDLSPVALLKVFTTFTQLEEKIVKVAQRSGNRYASFSVVRELGKGKEFCEKAAKKELSRQRGALAYRENTLEFRVFKGTLKVETILNYIHFCDSFVSWGKQLSLTQALTASPSTLWTAYKEYIEKNEKRGKALLAYFTKKGV